MPQILSRLDSDSVYEVLRKRGWGFHAQSGVGIRLSKKDPNPDNTFKTTGQRKRQLMVPISRPHLEEIMTQSRNISQAVQQIEAMSVGAQLEPDFNTGTGSSKSIDPALYEKLISQRIENEMAKVTEQSDKQMEALRRKNEQLEAKLEQMKASTAKNQPGKRKQPKGGVLEKIRQIDPEPELTPEQQAALDAVMSQTDDA